VERSDFVLLQGMFQYRTKKPQKIRKGQLLFGTGIEPSSYRIRCTCANHHWTSVVGSRIE